METCDPEIRIRLIDGAKHSSLRLEGTVLVHSYKQPGIERIRYIPLELLSISTGRRYDARRLIIALLCPLAAILIVIAMFSGLNPEKEKMPDTFVVAIPTIGVCGIALFVILMIRFLQRESTVRLEVGTEGFRLEFWKTKKNRTAIDNLLRSIERRQRVVARDCVDTFEHSITFSNQKTLFWKFLALVCFCAIPAVVLVYMRLLVLLAIPPIWYLYKVLVFQVHPPEYRHAWRAYTCGNWGEALAELDKLNAIMPGYVPATTLEAYVRIRNDDFAKALQAAEKLPEEDLELKRSIQNEILYAERLCKRRWSAISDDAGDSERE